MVCEPTGFLTGLLAETRGGGATRRASLEALGVAPRSEGGGFLLRRLDVEVVDELKRVRAHSERLNLALAFVGDPAVN